MCCSSCKEETSEVPSIPTEKRGVYCVINGVDFVADIQSPEKLGWSFQMSQPSALSIWGKTDTSEIRLYIQTEQFKTGTFTMPTQARLTYTNTNGTSFPITDTGVITITRFSDTEVKGIFTANHLLNDSTTRTFHAGTFYITR